MTPETSQAPNPATLLRQKRKNQPRPPTPALPPAAAQPPTPKPRPVPTPKPLPDPNSPADMVRRGFRERYGKWWPPVGGKPAADIYIEFQAFRHNIKGPKAPGKFQHFKNIVDAIWNNPASPKKFIWNPWSERMLREACETHYIGIAGSRSSGKSLTFAVWGLVNWLAAPGETKVIFTSTSLKDSRGRIWGDVEAFFQAACIVFGGEANMPGELVSSQGLIRFRADGQQSDKYGLVLVAGEKSREKESIGKLIGFKANRMILVADEMPELSESLIIAAESNLSANPEFQLVGLGNPASYYDPFGTLCEPAEGWASINDGMDEWKTKRGVCLRFDGERSPNILAGQNLYPWMFTEAKLHEAREMMGETSARYARMVKGAWCPTGAADSIFSPADIIKYQGDKPAVWQEPPTPVAGFDPAFTNGGDKSVLHFGKFGTTIDGMKVLELGEAVTLLEDRDVKNEARTFQIARQVAQECAKRQVHPRHLAVDSTGAGAPFCDVLRSTWSGEFLAMNFSGAASDLPASGTDSTPSKERYSNKVSEIWFVGREFLQSRQFKGIKPSLARELCARTYETRERGKVRVESKVDMKARIGSSPDMSDAALLALAVCRHRLGISSSLSSRNWAKEEPHGSRYGVSPTPWKKFSQKFAKMSR